MKKNPSVLILTTIQGHESLAHAIEEQLIKEGITPTVYSYPDPIISAYRVFYHHAPKLMKVAYLGLNKTSLEQFGKQYLMTVYASKLEQLIENHRPDVVVSTNWAFNPALDEYCKTHPIPVVNIISDPRTYYNLNVMRNGAINCVFDETAVQLIKKDVPNAKVAITGWPVRSTFERRYERALVRKKLGFNNNQLLYVFVTGSEGTKKVGPIIEKLAAADANLQLCVICGRNEQLYNELQSVASSLSKNSRTTLQVIGFTKKLDEFLQAADLVIGKAGPNTLFETTATRTPFVATIHIAGQEDGNLDIITEYGLGFVAEQKDEALNLLIKIAEDKSLLDQFRKSIENTAQYNEQSKKKIVSLIVSASKKSNG